MTLCPKCGNKAFEFKTVVFCPTCDNARPHITLWPIRPPKVKE